MPLVFMICIRISSTRLFLNPDMPVVRDFFANFKRETGMSPNDWLQRRRIKAATALLRSTNRKLEDIAAACASVRLRVSATSSANTPAPHPASIGRRHDLSTGILSRLLT
jgi:methylphosphotriester-DNA--protein-cysteine methyltransferase